jgi:hypothetical protein
MLVTALLSPASDDVAELTLAMTRCRCRVLLMMTLPSRRWPWRNVVADAT